MLIDWFTVAAQALNFIILVWLMKRVLYKPIMAAINARETLVAAEMADAAAKRTLADAAVEEFRHKNEVFDRERAALLVKASEAAKAEGARLLEAARAAADDLQSRRRDALEHEVKDVSQVLGRRAQQAFFALARRALKDLANGSLEEQAAALFCERLRATKGEDRDRLATAIQTSGRPVSIRSAFALPANVQGAIQTVIDEIGRRPIVVRFEVAPDLISGIELTAEGQRVGWSVADYVASLERDMTNSPPTAPPAPAATPPAEQPTPSAPAALRAVS